MSDASAVALPAALLARLRAARSVAALTGAGVIELHGGIARVRCSRGCGTVSEWAAGGADEPPRCTRCGAYLRPDVVWFEEMLPEAALAQAEAAARRCDVLLVVGTSAEVFPAAALPDAAQRSGAVVVEINPQRTVLSARADHVLTAPAGAAVPALVAGAWPPAS